MRAILGLALLFCLFATPACAGEWLSELRLGGLAQNIESMAGKHERGADINAEVLFATAFAPTGDAVQDVLFGFRPHIGATYNFSGTTSKLYAGLTWDAPLAHGFFLEGSLGLALHDGSVADEPGRAQYGCRVNFRESAALGYALDANWRVMAMIDHMSNADLCAQNRGLTNAGVRLGYRLD
jgi:lipid A 3-O-deacylase